MPLISGRSSTKFSDTNKTTNTTMSEQTYKIVSLQASNIKVLRAINITPDGNVITLSGDNGAGKSSILDSIEMALCGKDRIPAQPIRRGASKAQIICKLNGLTVTRSMTATGSTIKVVNDEGQPQKSPQAILDSLTGALSFDPLGFSRMRAAEQLATLRKLVGLDTTEIDQRRMKVYNERTIVNRELDSAKARLAQYTFDESAPAEEVSISDLNVQLGKANAANSANQRERNALEMRSKNAADAQSEVNKQLSEIERIKQQLKDAESVLADKQAVLKSAQQMVEEQRQRVDSLIDADTTEITKKMEESVEINHRVQQNRNYLEQKKIVDDKKSASDKLTSALDAIDAEKQKALESCKFPLEGLGISDDEVTFGGLPFAQASTAEQLRISTAIGMALNPKLKVVFIRDGSLLDKNGLQAIAKMAQEKDYQVWMEDARSTDPTALVIEDGMIRGQPQVKSCDAAENMDEAPE